MAQGGNARGALSRKRPTQFFFSTATTSERVATLLERAERMGLWFNPTAAENLASAIADEAASAPGAEAMTMRKLLEHAAFEKVRRVQEKIVSS